MAPDSQISEEEESQSESESDQTMMDVDPEATKIELSVPNTQVDVQMGEVSVPETPDDDHSEVI